MVTASRGADGKLKVTRTAIARAHGRNPATLVIWTKDRVIEGDPGDDNFDDAVRGSSGYCMSSTSLARRSDHQLYLEAKLNRNASLAANRSHHRFSSSLSLQYSRQSQRILCSAERTRAGQASFEVCATAQPRGPFGMLAAARCGMLSSFGSTVLT